MAKGVMPKGLTNRKNPLPAISDSNMSTARPDTPEYVRKARANRSKIPDPPKDSGQGDLPASFVNQVNLKDYKVNNSNMNDHLKKLDVCMKRFNMAGLNRMITSAKEFEFDFKFVSKGLYRTCCKDQVNREKILDHLIQGGWTGFLIAMWKRITNEIDKVCPINVGAGTVGAKLWEKIETEYPYLIGAVENLRQAHVVVWNGTDLRNRERLSLIFYDIIDYFHEVLNSQYIYPMVVKTNHPVFGLAKSILGTMHNFAHNIGYSVQRIKEKGLLKTIAKFRETDSLTLKTKAIILLAYLMSEGQGQSDNDIIGLTEKEIKYLIKVFESALKGTNFHSLQYGYNADEICHALTHIATTDSNKGMLTANGILPLLVQGMSTKSDDLRAASAGCIWALAFDKKSCELITQTEGCVEKLRELAKCSNSDVRKQAEGALWKIEGEAEHIKDLKSKEEKEKNTGGIKKQPHLMISYNHDTQTEVVEMKNRLETEGFKLWIDTEQMSKFANTLDAMSFAVENADVVIVCFTEKYTESVACRAEAEYAWKLGKEILGVRMQPGFRLEKGWLSMALGNNIWYDLTKPQTYEDKLHELIAKLGDKGRRTITDDGGFATSAATSQSKVPAAAPPRSLKMVSSMNKSAVKFSKWNQAEVGKWLEENNLKETSKKLNLDGDLLCELVMMKNECPETYYSILKTDLKLSWMETLKLNSAIGKLE